MRTLGAAAALALATSVLAPAPVGAVLAREPIKFYTLLSGTTKDWTYTYKLGPGFDDLNGKPGMCLSWQSRRNSDAEVRPPDVSCYAGWHVPKRKDSYIILAGAGVAGRDEEGRVTDNVFGTLPSTERVVLTYALSPKVVKIPRTQSRLLTMHGVRVRWFAKTTEVPGTTWVGAVTIKTQEQRCQRIKGRKTCLWKTTGKLTTNSMV